MTRRRAGAAAARWRGWRFIEHHPIDAAFILRVGDELAIRALVETLHIPARLGRQRGLDPGVQVAIAQLHEFAAAIGNEVDAAAVLRESRLGHRHGAGRGRGSCAPAFARRAGVAGAAGRGSSRVCTPVATSTTHQLAVGGGTVADEGHALVIRGPVLDRQRLAAAGQDQPRHAAGLMSRDVDVGAGAIARIAGKGDAAGRRARTPARRCATCRR